MRKLLTLAVLVACLASCKSSCRQLSEALCDCTITTTEKTSCLQLAASHEQNNGPTDADQQVCAGLLPLCDCHLIGTPQGKANCGLSRPLASPDAGF
jgi:hypothetical protein